MMKLHFWIFNGMCYALIGCFQVQPNPHVPKSILILFNSCNCDSFWKKRSNDFAFSLICDHYRFNAVMFTVVSSFCCAFELLIETERYCNPMDNKFSFMGSQFIWFMIHEPRVNNPQILNLCIHFQCLPFGYKAIWILNNSNKSKSK